MTDAGAGRPAVGVAVLDLVEYFPPGMLSGPRIEKRHQIYYGAGPRRSDGMHCLSIMSPGGERRHNIEVGSLVAITFGGQRHLLNVPPERFRIRSQELVRIVEGDFSEEWARPYFDPGSPKYYLAEAQHPGGSASPPAVSETDARLVRSRPLPFDGSIIWKALVALLVVLLAARFLIG